MVCNRRFTFFISLVLFCSAAAPCAEEETVFFNQKSKKFHCMDCRHAKACTKNCIPVPHSEARSRGGVPGKICGGTCNKARATPQVNPSNDLQPDPAEPFLPPRAPPGEFFFYFVKLVGIVATIVVVSTKLFFFCYYCYQDDDWPDWDSWRPRREKPPTMIWLWWNQSSPNPPTEAPKDKQPNQIIDRGLTENP